jgi:hypothetical protein
MLDELKKEVAKVNSKNFEELALKLFHFQILHCKVYSDYVKNLKIEPNSIDSVEKIPFLPISFFKTKKVLSGKPKVETIFESSGTTGQNTSRHLVADTEFYKKISLDIFEKTYGSIENFHIIALLPSYLEKGNSSLVFMIQHFIEKSKSRFSGFYLTDYEAINDIFSKIREQNIQHKKILLWGVTYALLEFSESGFDFSGLENNLIVLETGGMKGRRKEMVKEELYDKLKSGFSVENIHSEYGMTELLSQSYSKNDAIFHESDSMKIVLREVNDPFKLLPKNSKKTGGINIIDLANVDSCCFIETQDLGQYGAEPNTFKVLGRFDNSDLRGCNLLIG